jgi:hypothetical protein
MVALEVAAVKRTPIEVMTIPMMVTALWAAEA